MPAGTKLKLAEHRGCVTGQEPMPTPCSSAGSVPISRPGARPRGRRPPRLALPPLPAPITTLDAPADSANTASQLIETGVPSYLSIEALVELACRAQRGADWRALYALVRRQLVSMRLLPAELPQLDPLRHMYQKIFTELLVSARRASQPEPLVDQPLLLPAAGADASHLLHASRYRSEFEELAVLGYGGFGVVCRCRSLVDGQEYAVKQIPFRYRSAEAAARTVREVAVFASLDHPNIVKYNTAWLEVAGRPPAAAGAAISGASSDAADSASWVQFERPAKVERSPASLAALAALAAGAAAAPPPFVSDGAVVLPSGGRSAVLPSVSGALPSVSSVLPSVSSVLPPASSALSSVSGTVTSVSSVPPSVGSGAVLPAGRFGAARPSAVGRFWAAAGSSSSSESGVPSTRQSRRAATGETATGRSWPESVAGDRSQSSRWRPAASAPAPGWLTLYIQMQLCERTLKDWLTERNQRPAPADAGGPLALVDAPRCRRLLRDVLLGLHFIHQRGIIHRDLKPANVFLAFSGRAMIGDFGLARPRAAAAAGAAGEPLTPLAEHSAAVGTSTYASPEQAAGGDYDQKTDVFSLGVVAYELFAPFGTAMERGLELRRLREERRLAAAVAERWPEVAAAVLSMTEPRPAARPCAAHLLTSPLFTSPADRLLQLEAAAAHQSRLLEARGARVRQLTEQLDSCRREAAVTERLLRSNCRQLRLQLAERDREVERLRALLKRAGLQPTESGETAPRHSGLS